MSSISQYLIVSLSLLSIIINGQETESPSSTLTAGGSGYSYYIDSFTLDADSMFDVPYPTDTCVLTSAISDTYVMYSCNTAGTMISKIDYGTDSDCMTAVTTGAETATGKGLYTLNGWSCEDDISYLTLQFGSCGVVQKDINVVPYVCYQDSVTSTYMKFFCNDANADDVYESISFGAFGTSSVCQIPTSSSTASISCAAFGTTGINVTAVMNDDSCTDTTPVTTTTTTTTSSTSSTSSTTSTVTTTAGGQNEGNHVHTMIIVMICLLSFMVTMIIQ